jgi:hypothetical protein
MAMQIQSAVTCLQDYWGIQPLLKIDLEFAEGQVICHPSLEETAQVVNTQLDEIAHQLMEVQDDCLGAINNTINPPPITLDGWSSEPLFQQCQYATLHFLQCCTFPPQHHYI